MAECVKVCQHFGLSYAVRTPLQAYSTRKLAKVAARLWGRSSVFGEGIKDLALYSGGSHLFRSCGDNMFESCAPLCPLEDFYQ